MPSFISVKFSTKHFLLQTGQMLVIFSPETSLREKLCQGPFSPLNEYQEAVIDISNAGAHAAITNNMHIYAH